MEVVYPYANGGTDCRSSPCKPSPMRVSKCLKVMEDALERFPDSPEVHLFFSEVSPLTYLERSPGLPRVLLGVAGSRWPLVVEASIIHGVPSRLYVTGSMDLAGT